MDKPFRPRKPVLPAALALAAALAATPGEAQAATHRFALSMLHFNVQYVAGGLVGFSPTPNPVLDQTAIQVEDQIIVESFEPVLDLFAAHPSWGVDIEFQGYLLDVLADRHPGVLTKLRVLAQSGQIEVVSFHYSDQIFLAYPKEDWVRSAELNRATFDKHGIPLGTTVFCQEGQAGVGLAEAMAEHGYRTLVWPKNLFSYQHGDGDPAPLYRFGDGTMITSRGLTYDDGQNVVDVNWWFVDDGELLATGDFDPYLPEHFLKDPAVIAEYEAELQNLEAAGYRIATVAEYIEAIEGLVPAVDPPPLLDGTWQPNSTDGIRRWLGGYGLWWKDERDNDVRTLGALAHRELLAAETLAASAGLPVSEEIAAGFRLLALGQVTDATGINPFRGEIEYGIAHFTEVLRLARDIIVRGKETLAADAVGIDTASGTVTPGELRPADLPETAAVVPITVSSGDRPNTVTWRAASAGHAVVSIAFGRGDERALSATFPGEMGDIVFTPGLASAPIHAPREAFVFDHFELALSDGLIGLSAAQFVIKDQAHVHIAAQVRTDTGDVFFHDDTAPVQEEVTWVFHVVQGSEAEATAIARAVNVTPKVWR